MNDSLIFCTVNANSNIFTNITVKSILKFHPNAKVFIVDAFTKLGHNFKLIDEEDSNNIEIIAGLPPLKNCITIDLNQTNLSEDEKLVVHQKLSCDDNLSVFNTGDLNHTINIQHAIDTIDQDFILIDCDAPLIHPVDFVANDSITSAQEMKYYLETQRAFLRTSYNRLIPFIQYMNVKMMKETGIKYYDEQLLTRYLDLALLTSKNHILLFPTGTLFLKQIIEKNIPYKNIEYKKYVDHFGGSTWKNTTNEENKRKFFSKYQNLFKNRIIEDD